MQVFSHSNGNVTCLRSIIDRGGGKHQIVYVVSTRVLGKYTLHCYVWCACNLLALALNSVLPCTTIPYLNRHSLPRNTQYKRHGVILIETSRFKSKKHESP